MTEDIRDKSTVRHEDVLGLNFIKPGGPYFFRRYYRNGLRSHVIEVLRKADVEKEIRGTVVDGVKRFPKPVPVKILRLFRRRFADIAEVRKEIERVKQIEAYLTADCMAVSDEFVVEYRDASRSDLMLCGLQEFVRGERLNPWHMEEFENLGMPTRSPGGGGARTRFPASDRAAARLKESVGRFVRNTKAMVYETGHIPDLAGDGNLLLTGSGGVKLVDINNVSPVVYSDEIYLDDLGYPVCDKSVEALYRIEQVLSGRPPDPGEPVYRHFLAPERQRCVRDLDQTFHTHFNHLSPGRNGVPV